MGKTRVEPWSLGFPIRHVTSLENRTYYMPNWEVVGCLSFFFFSSSFSFPLWLMKFLLSKTNLEERERERIYIIDDMLHASYLHSICFPQIVHWCIQLVDFLLCMLNYSMFCLWESMTQNCNLVVATKTWARMLFEFLNYAWPLIELNQLTL